MQLTFSENKLMYKIETPRLYTSYFGDLSLFYTEAEVIAVPLGTR